MRRREVIAALGGAAAWPLAARAQQAMPVIGFLDGRSPEGMASRLASFRQGLKEVGLVEGENVTIIYRWAEDRVERLPEMASELARQATVIVTTGGPPAAFAAKAATTTIPIVFLVGEDPARLGLVTHRHDLAVGNLRTDHHTRRRGTHLFVKRCHGNAPHATNT
jgi:putative ABC transport system substrate-binding protein